MQSNSATKPMISIDVLGKMMRKLSVDQLKQLPVDKLPDSIPDVVYRIGSAEKGAVLEDLLFRRDTDRMTRHCDDLDMHGKEIADALESAEGSGLPPVIKEFLRGVGEISTLNQETGRKAEVSDKIEAKCEELHALLKEVINSSLLKSERVLVQHRATAARAE